MLKTHAFFAAALLGAAVSTTISLAGCSADVGGAPADAGPDAAKTHDGGVTYNPAGDDDSGSSASVPEAGSFVDSGFPAYDGAVPDAGTCPDPGAPSVVDAGSTKCTPDQMTAAWADLGSRPIGLLPSSAAGVSFTLGADGGAEVGPSFDDLLKTGCQPYFNGNLDDCSGAFEIFGDADQVQVTVDAPTRRITFLGVYSTYKGTLTFKSADAQHTYVAGVLGPIQKDGAPFTIDWSSATARNAAADELYRGIMATFAPKQTLNAANCVTSGLCVAAAIGSPLGEIDILPAHVTFIFSDIEVAQPGASAVNEIWLE